jgi:hypothetical protein
MNTIPSTHSLCIASLIVALGCCGVAISPANAREPGAGNQYAAGSSIGLSVGANPPPGFYYTNAPNYYSTYTTAANDSVAEPGIKAIAAADVSRLFWSAPFTVLGATELAYVVIPVVDVSLQRSTGTYQKTAFGDTAIIPVNLSWTVATNWHVAGTFGFYPPDGQYTAGAKINIGDNFWTIEPSGAISYIGVAYNFTVHPTYDTNTENLATHYKSGDQIFVDWTARKNIGNLELGAVGYYDAQVTGDANNGVVFPHTNMTDPLQVAVGGIAGYNFGKVKLQVYVTQDVVASGGATRGTRTWGRISFAF